MSQRTIPGAFLDEENATKLYTAGMGLVELNEMDCGELTNLLQLVADSFSEVLDRDNGFNFCDDRESALEHLRKQKVKLEEAIAALEGKSSAEVEKWPAGGLRLAPRDS